MVSIVSSSSAVGSTKHFSLALHQIFSNLTWIMRFCQRTPARERCPHSQGKNCCVCSAVYVDCCPRVAPIHGACFCLPYFCSQVGGVKGKFRAARGSPLAERPSHAEEVQSPSPSQRRQVRGSLRPNSPWSGNVSRQTYCCTIISKLLRYSVAL